jgi:hypothetical protein
MPAAVIGRLAAKRGWTSFLWLLVAIRLAAVAWLAAKTNENGVESEGYTAAMKVYYT